MLPPSCHSQLSRLKFCTWRLTEPQGEISVENRGLQWEGRTGSKCPLPPSATGNAILSGRNCMVGYTPACPWNVNAMPDDFTLFSPEGLEQFLLINLFWDIVAQHGGYSCKGPFPHCRYSDCPDQRNTEQILIEKWTGTHTERCSRGYELQVPGHERL